jgi:hypothetical protein
MMDGYSPLSPGTISYTTRSLGDYDDSNSLMDAVFFVSDYFMSYVSLINNGVWVASYDDGTPFVAYNPDNQAVAINGFVGDSRQFAGDMIILSHNAVIFSTGGGWLSVDISVTFFVAGTGIDDAVVGLPAEFSLSQNYPNPFNPATEIKFALPENAHVKIEIFNVLGQKVRTLVDADMDAGYKSIVWNGTDASGRNLSSGVYLYRMQAGNKTFNKKMLMLK